MINFTFHFYAKRRFELKLVTLQGIEKGKKEKGIEKFAYLAHSPLLVKN